MVFGELFHFTMLSFFTHQVFQNHVLVIGELFVVLVMFILFLKSWKYQIKAVTITYQNSEASTENSSNKDQEEALNSDFPISLRFCGFNNSLTEWDSVSTSCFCSSNNSSCRLHSSKSFDIKILENSHCHLDDSLCPDFYNDIYDVAASSTSCRGIFSGDVSDRPGLNYDCSFDEEDIRNSHSTVITVNQSANSNSCTTPLKRLVHRKYSFKEKLKLELQQESLKSVENINN